MAGSNYRTLPNRGGSSRSDNNGGHGWTLPNVGAGNRPVAKPLPKVDSLSDMHKRENGPSTIGTVGQ